MNKTLFMSSMTEASETVMKIGITAHAQEVYEKSLITAATALAEKEVEDKELPEEEVEAELAKAIELVVDPIKKASWGKALSKEAEGAFLLIQKSIRAFHMSNNKTDWKIIGYGDNLEVFKRMFGTIGTTEAWRKNVGNLAGMLQGNLDIHRPNDNISHHNGFVWKKNKNDKNRFTELNTCVENFNKIVS
jgi:hypothetical protein